MWCYCIGATIRTRCDCQCLLCALLLYFFYDCTKKVYLNDFRTVCQIYILHNKNILQNVLILTSVLGPRIRSTLLHSHAWKSAQNCEHLVGRSGGSQEVLYKHHGNRFLNLFLLTDPYPQMALQRRHAQASSKKK